MSGSLKRKVMTPSTQRAATGRRVATTVVSVPPRRQGTMRDAVGQFRGPRKAAHAAAGTPPEPQPASWSDLAAVAQPAAVRAKS